MYYDLMENLTLADVQQFVLAISVDNAIQVLQNAQCKTEEIYMSQEHTHSNNTLYEDIYNRINLQSIGYFIKEGSTLG